MTTALNINFTFWLLQSQRTSLQRLDTKTVSAAACPSAHRSPGRGSAPRELLLTVTHAVLRRDLTPAPPTAAAHPRRAPPRLGALPGQGPLAPRAGGGAGRPLTGATRRREEATVTAPTAECAAAAPRRDGTPARRQTRRQQVNGLQGPDTAGGSRPPRPVPRLSAGGPRSPCPSSGPHLPSPHRPEAAASPLASLPAADTILPDPRRRPRSPPVPSGSRTQLLSRPLPAATPGATPPSQQLLLPPLLSLSLALRGGASAGTCVRARASPGWEEGEASRARSSFPLLPSAASLRDGTAERPGRGAAGVRPAVARMPGRGRGALREGSRRGRSAGRRLEGLSQSQCLPEESPVGGRVPVRQQAAGAAHAQWVPWRLARSLRPRPGFGGAPGGWVAARGLRGAARRCSREVTGGGGSARVSQFLRSRCCPLARGGRLTVEGGPRARARGPRTVTGP